MPLIQTGNIRTYYELQGSGPHIVFIHGAGASHDMWFPQVHYFSEKYTVLTYDIRGHQQSEGCDERYSCALYAEDLHRLLTALNIAEPIVCGLSLGGMIAQEYAVRHPTGLRALVLADTALSSALTWSERLQKALFPASLVKRFIRSMSPQSYADWSFKYFDIDPHVADYLKNEQMKMDREELLKMIDAIYSFKRLPVETITVPTLIIVGERERKAVFKHSDTMLRLIPSSERVIIPCAGHASNLENPDHFNRVVGEFLQRVLSI